MSRIEDQDETGSESDNVLQDNTVSTTDDDAQNEATAEDTIGLSWSCVVL